MPSVVRVKRRHDEEPLEAFVLNGKKRHIDQSSSVLGSEISTILKFAGTVESQDEVTTKQVARLSKDEAKELVRKHRQPSNATERARREMRAQGQESRFKVVNCFRTIDTECDELAKKEITIVDIEKQPSSPIPPTEASSPASTSTVAASNVASTSRENITTSTITPTDSDGYVYDLYLPENEQQADNVDYEDHHLRIKVLDSLVYEDRFNSDDEDNDSEDSNQENYYSNDYPDEDENRDDDSIGERDIMRAVNGLHLGSDDEDLLSSDNDDVDIYDDDYVTVDEIDVFESNVDLHDVDRYGAAYARYKARVLKKTKSDSESGSEEYKYCSGSDSGSD